ncbi:hypothetical protein [Rhizobium leguminosarum]|uniref:hypothetical protein n=1 Tax=Rhizobium leguminosarum TaxID=384 RepID=UPI001C92B5AB|nr:hypothetical protein [Rhizobium leguminosarum]MBY2987949.1 hypothetical protein [Rhizobium leguminosarum]MBY3021757.1 hypothetical protein [Rhizobium leguminosarum]
MALAKTRVIDKQAGLVAELPEIPLGRLGLLFAYGDEDLLDVDSRLGVREA